MHEHGDLTKSTEVWTERSGRPDGGEFLCGGGGRRRKRRGRQRRLRASRSGSTGGEGYDDAAKAMVLFNLLDTVTNAGDLREQSELRF